MPGMARTVSADVAGAVVVAVRAPSAAATPSPTTSLCETPCAGGTTGVLCGVAVALVVTSVLLLLLTSRRDTFLGLLARVRRAGLVRRRRRQRTPWLVRSPVSLGVLRV